MTQTSLDIEARHAVLTGTAPRAETLASLRRATAEIAAALESSPSAPTSTPQAGTGHLPAEPAATVSVPTKPAPAPVAEVPTTRPRRRPAIDPDTARAGTRTR